MVRQLAGYHSFHSIAKRIQLMESGGCGRMQGFQSYITNLVACLTEIDPLERAAGETPKCGTIFVPNNSGHHAGKRALRQQGEVGANSIGFLNLARSGPLVIINYTELERSWSQS
jgi:hypothetical protein